jgi:hypothetical protein
LIIHRKEINRYVLFGDLVYLTSPLYQVRMERKHLDIDWFGGMEN